MKGGGAYMIVFSYTSDNNHNKFKLHGGYHGRFKK